MGIGTHRRHRAFETSGARVAVAILVTLGSYANTAMQFAPQTRSEPDRQDKRKGK